MTAAVSPTPTPESPTDGTTPPPSSTLVEGRDYIIFLSLDEDDGGIRGFVMPDNEGSVSSDYFSRRIFIQGGIPIGQGINLITALHVLSNGAISLNKGFRINSVPGFPLVNSDVQIIALFLANHDARSRGTISYKVYTSSSNNMDIVSNFIRFNGGSNNFTGTWMIVAEWRDVPSYNGGIPDDENNTYQLVIISDARETHSVNIYNCNNLGWSASGGDNAAIGYNFVGPNIGSTVPNFFNYVLSKRNDVEMTACLNTGEGRNRPWSTLVFKIGETVNPNFLARSRCFNELNRDRARFGVITPSRRGDCPCHIIQALSDRRFFFHTVLPGSTLCFLPRFLRRRNGNFGGYRCCYSLALRGSLVTRDSQGRGSFTFLLLSFSFEFFSLQDNFALAETCCDAGLCDEFYSHRPPSDCSFYRPTRRGWFFGDPHIRTLDGTSYTFNGWGEYFLIQSDAFTFQGRTAAVNSSINGSATQFSAFAFGIQNAVVEVRIHEATGLLQLLLNEVDITDTIPNVNDTNLNINDTNINSTLVSFERIDQNAIVASFNNDITITITLSMGILSSVNGIPEELQGTLSGLLGNFNDNNTDDFVYQNGTMLDSGATDAMIHSFGQSWQINDTTSLFTYPFGVTFENFSFPNHIPVFLDEVINQSDTNATAQCGGNSQCIFDAAQTGDISIGLNTMQISSENVAEEVATANFPPQIKGPLQFEVIINQESVLIIDINDTNLASFSIVNGDVQGGTLTNNASDPLRYIFTWTPSAEVTSPIIFLAVDEGNASASYEPTIQINPCLNNGNSTTEGLSNLAANPVLLNCDCPSAWEGSTCEVDVNGCRELACFMGVSCIDNVAPNEGATCGSCPTGFSGNGVTCEDINECLVPGVCQQDCNNLPGNFECTCQDGFQMINSTHCRDVDECLTIGRCHQVCTNNEGSFNCSCDEGFQILPNNSSCEVIPAFACDNVTNNCSQLCVRDMQLNTSNCSCSPGFQLNTDGVSCDDENECLSAVSPCEQICNNTNGSFICSCRDGFTSEGANCNDINECFQGALAGTSPCGSSMLCDNMPGTLMCSCPFGTFNDNGVCMEINEVTTTVSGMPIILTETVRQNIIIVTLATFTLDVFNTTSQTQFISLVVLAVNRYCQDDDIEECAFISLVKRNSPVTAADITITNIINATSGNGIEFYVFVRGMGGDRILSQQNLLAALRAYSSALQDAGFPATFRVLIEMVTQPPPVPTRKLTTGEIVGIFIASLVAAILLFVIVALVIYCCYSRRRRGKVVLYTYGAQSLTIVTNQQELRGGEIVHENLYSNTEEDNQSMQSIRLNFIETCLNDMEDPVEIEEGPGNGKENMVITNKRGNSPLDISVSFLEDAESDADRATAL